MRSVLFPLALVGSLLSPAAIFAETAPRTIAVSGEGEVSVVPDMATVSLGVLIEATETGSAMDQASSATAAILAKLAEVGVADADVRSGSVRLTPRYGRTVLGGTDFSKIEGYTAQNTVDVKVRDINALGGILSAVVGQGANTINGIDFGLQHPEDVMDAARRAAVAEAIRRAALYADAAGVALGPLMSLNENGYTGVPMFRGGPMMMDAMASAPSMDVPVAPGEITVSANVSMVYEIQDK